MWYAHNKDVKGDAFMKKKLLVICLLTTSFVITGCKTPKKEDDSGKITGTIQERLKKLSRVKSVTTLSSTRDFENVFELTFEQYIDHKDHSVGTFEQRIQFGYNGIDCPNVYTTNGYFLYDINYAYYQESEIELAFLLHGNYLYVEHRYFGESLPVSLDYNNNDTWKYLTTEQAADDAHEIVTQFKRILDGKWLSTGASKGGMTTEMFAYYHPGDVDLYVPYVAPFCNSFHDTRMMTFIYEEAGDQQYGEEKAAKLRDEVLEFQVKLLEYREILAPRFYTDGTSSGEVFSTSATQDTLYDAAVLEFAIGFWQYNQDYKSVEKALDMSETSEAALTNKINQFYSVFTSVCAPDDYSINNDFTPYYIQAYQELGNYGYDFHYIRDALTDKSLLTISEEDELDLMWKLVLNDAQIQLEQRDLMYTKINNMLKTTEEQFIIIYGSSDPWYSVRPDDVEDRENINIYVNKKHPHGSNVSNFDRKTSANILNKIKGIMGVDE